jgi:hypothetical protein
VAPKSKSASAAMSSGVLVLKRVELTDCYDLSTKLLAISY